MSISRNMLYTMTNHQCRFGYWASSASFTFMVISMYNCCVKTTCGIKTTNEFCSLSFWSDHSCTNTVPIEFGCNTPKGLGGIVTLKKRYYQEPIILSIGETGGRASYCARSYCHVKPVLGTTLTECWSSVTGAALLNLKRLSSVSAIYPMVARMEPHY